MLQAQQQQQQQQQLAVQDVDRRDYVNSRSPLDNLGDLSPRSRIPFFEKLSPRSRQAVVQVKQLKLG
jgi:hypothetical protein